MIHFLLTLVKVKPSTLTDGLSSLSSARNLAARRRDEALWRRRGISLIFCICFSQIGFASDIPFRLEDNIILVNGMINGKGPYQLIVDTGATETVITPPTGKALNIQSFPAGDEQRMGRLESISTGGAELKNLSVYIFDPPQALTLRLDSGIDYNGILGYSFLSQFLIGINYQDKILSLNTFPKEPVPQASTTKDQVSFEIKDRHIHVRAEVDGKGPLIFLVDTGAANSLIIPSRAHKIGLIGKPLQNPRNASTTDSTSISLGKIDVEIPILIYTPPQAAAYGITCDGILGCDFLSRFKVTIDYRNKRLTLVPLKK